MTSYKLITEILGLKPLEPEGGFFAQTYKSSQSTSGDVTRALSTAIYYLITAQSFSAFHQLKSDEIYHFYLGEPAVLTTISSNGVLREEVLGPDIVSGQRPQAIVPAGTWQALHLGKRGEGWALLGTTVSPGFEFDDFVLGKKEELVRKYPHLESQIVKLCRV